MGPFVFDHPTVSGWKSTAIGVYYIGAPNGRPNDIASYYVGKGCSKDAGIQCRLFDHLGRWVDTTRFMYRECSTEWEAEQLEAAEIKRLQPKYNKVGL